MQESGTTRRNPYILYHPATVPHHHPLPRYPASVVLLGLHLGHARAPAHADAVHAGRLPALLRQLLLHQLAAAGDDQVLCHCFVSLNLMLV